VAPEIGENSRLLTFFLKAPKCGFKTLVVFDTNACWHKENHFPSSAPLRTQEIGFCLLNRLLPGNRHPRAQTVNHKYSHNPIAGQGLERPAPYPVSKAPKLPRAAARSVTPAVSARNLLFPRQIQIPPTRRRRSISVGVRPPSGSHHHAQRPLAGDRSRGDATRIAYPESRRIRQ